MTEPWELDTEQPLVRIGDRLQVAIELQNAAHCFTSLEAVQALHTEMLDVARQIAALPKLLEALKALQLILLADHPSGTVSAETLRRARTTVADALAMVGGQKP